jgi:hypothetical protein
MDSQALGKGQAGAGFTHLQTPKQKKNKYSYL